MIGRHTESWPAGPISAAVAVGLLVCLALGAALVMPVNRAIASTTAAAVPTVFVRGAFGKDSSPSRSEVIAGLGFNTVMTGPYRQLLDPLAAEGIKGIVWLGNWISSPTCAFERDDRTVRSQVATVAGNAAILAYFLGDEPKASECANAPAMFKERSALVHTLDPGSQTFTVIQQTENGVVRNYAPWVGTVDIVGFDIYPCNVASSTCNYQAIDDAITSIENAGFKRYWAVVQDFQDCYYRLPTPQELRGQFDHWARSSMSGYLVFSWNYQSVNPKCVGTNLESHPDNISELKYENSRVFVPSSGAPGRSSLLGVVGAANAVSPRIVAVSMAAAALVVAFAVLMLLRRRQRRDRR